MVFRGAKQNCRKDTAWKVLVFVVLLVLIFPTSYLSVFSPNARKYEPGKFWKGAQKFFWLNYITFLSAPAPPCVTFCHFFCQCYSSLREWCTFWRANIIIGKNRDKDIELTIIHKKNVDIFRERKRRKKESQG